MLKRRSEDGSVESTSWPPPGGEKKRKRKSRWAANEAEKTFIPGMPTVIPTGLSVDQEKQYLVHLQIEEVSRRLRSGDLGIPSNPEERSPSPEPIYNNEGKRLNTREYRTRKHLEEERHQLVTKAIDLNTDYKPPADYKPPLVRVNDKVMIPQDEHPDINFVGLLIGPRGNTLKELEKETGAKVIIRGRGSVKEGKIGRKAGQPLPGEDEPLHAYITANNPENVKTAAEKIKEIIEQGIQVPEGQNDLRRQQLRQLALLNGTLRENDGLAKLKQLQEAQEIVTNQIICTICGGAGHLSKDCREKRPGDSLRQMQQQQQNPNTIPVSSVDRAKMDSEYMSLMAELGEGPPPPVKSRFSNPVPPPARMPFRQSRFSEQPPPGFNRDHPPPLSQSNQAPVSAPRSLWDQPPSHQGPPSLLSLNTSSQFNPPPSQPPPLMPPSSMPSNNHFPPWQSNSGPPNTSHNSVNMGVPPPSLLSAPPPPPPSSQSSFPWQQPPPVSLPSSIPPPWQSAPPPPPSGMPPWQQAPPNPVAPPPPPPSSFGMAPPPPPPSQFDVIVNMLGSRPPPPPPN